MEDEARRDLEFRRQLLRQAAKQVWQADLGEAPPVGGFRLNRDESPRDERGDPAAWAFGDEVAGSAADLARRYRARQVSPLEVTRMALELAEATQSTLNAFITLIADSAVEDARASEARFMRQQPRGPLDGVPVAVKDLIHMAGVRTTCASRVMADFVAGEDATVIERLRAGGAILIGKTNLHEFAYGGTGDVSCFGPARNPRNQEHVPGGSSSGSAAAVGGGICPVAVGTDTACSIRTPAALCGIVGLKPTYGRVPTKGVIPLSWSQDHVGPMTSCVQDAALALSVIGDFEMTHMGVPVGRSLAIGVCQELFFERLDPEVRQLVESAVPMLGEVREVRIPHVKLAGAVQALITSPEAGAFHDRWLAQRPDEYHWSVRNRLEAAREVDACDYVQATRLRGLLAQEMSAALADVDVLAMPTVAVPAPRFGQREIRLEDGVAEPVGPLMLRNAAPMNVTGFPAITVPCGMTTDGLPVGLQFVARPWEEGLLLGVARAFEVRFARE